MHPLQITDLTKQYGRTSVLTNIDLTVQENELFALVGPNGAGKTTLFDIVLNYIHPSEGMVSIFGHDSVHDVVAAHRQLGVLPQDFDVYPGLTARQHLSYAIDANEADDDPYALLDQVGLEAVAEQRASEFSHGMTQRLAVAMALVGQPELLILDEPFSGLDPNGKRGMRSLIAAEQERGATVVLSSHDLTHVRDISTRIGILTDGKLVATGTEETLRSNTPRPDPTLDDIFAYYTLDRSP